MPHECTNCGRRFADGSKEMLSGCPDCGGTKFQFRPGSAARAERAAEADDGSGPDRSGPAPDPAPGPGTTDPSDDPFTTPRPTGGDAADADEADIIEADSGPRDPGEDRAQADARSGMATGDDLAGADDAAAADDLAGAGDPEPDPPTPDEQPDLAALRAELNEQFESIKVLNPGQYELNLMELYDREEYIISLREDGRYVIEVPESWRRDPDGG